MLCLCLDKTLRKISLMYAGMKLCLACFACHKRMLNRGCLARLKTSGSLRVQSHDVCEKYAVSWLDSPQTCAVCRRCPDSPIPISPVGRYWNESRQSESRHCECAERTIALSSFASSRAVLFATCHEQVSKSEVRSNEPIEFVQHARISQEDASHTRIFALLVQSPEPVHCSRSRKAEKYPSM
jgi:hypothetical protein